MATKTTILKISVRLLISLLTFLPLLVFSQSNNFNPDVILTYKISKEVNSSNIIGKRIEVNSLIKKEDGHILKGKGKSLKWFLNIEVINSNAVLPYFEKLILPKGAKLRAYSFDNEFSTNEIEENENIKKGIYNYALPIIKSNKVILEVNFENQELYKEFELEIKYIGAVIQSNVISTDNKRTNSADFGKTPNCFVNANCSEADPWDNQRRATAKYIYVDENNNIGHCSGSMINNTNEDYTPYFLTAQHCTGYSDPKLLAQYIFYFNYQSPNCSNPSSDAGLENQTITGCTMMATSGLGQSGMPNGSDFTLLKLNSTPPSSFNVYYLGWNVNPQSTYKGPGVVFHHSEGDIKKVSFWDKANISITSTSECAFNCYSTLHGGGTALGGASGASICDANGLVVAVLNTGSGSCVSNTQLPFVQGGIMFYHWQSTATNNPLKLPNYLDPKNLGVKTFRGINYNIPTNIEFSNSTPSLEYEIYPNPTYKSFKINDVNQVSTVEIFNVIGNSLGIWTDTNNLDISSFERGTYLVKVVFSNNITKVYKLHKL